MTRNFRATPPAPAAEIGYSMTAFVEVRHRMRRGERRPPAGFGTACLVLWAVASGYTPAQAAQLADVHPTTARRILRGRMHPSAYPAPLVAEPHPLRAGGPAQGLLPFA